MVSLPLKIAIGAVSMAFFRPAVHAATRAGVSTTFRGLGNFNRYFGDYCTGTDSIKANAASIAGGSASAISVFATNNTDLVRTSTAISCLPPTRGPWLFIP